VTLQSAVIKDHPIYKHIPTYGGLIISFLEWSWNCYLLLSIMLNTYIR